MWVIYRGGWWLSRPYKSKELIRAAFVGTAQSPAALINSNTRGGWWVSRPYKSDLFVGVARITSHPCCSICRGGWSRGSRACHYRGGSITSRSYKKFVPLLQTVFHVVKEKKLSLLAAITRRGTLTPPRLGHLPLRRRKKMEWRRPLWERGVIDHTGAYATHTSEWHVKLPGRDTATKEFVAMPPFFF